MRKRTKLMIGSVAVLLVCFVTPASAANGSGRQHRPQHHPRSKQCEQVKAYLSDYVDFSGDEACSSEGYALCIEAELHGTINGRMLILAAAPIVEFPAAVGDTMLWRVPIIYETKHGEIYGDAVGMNFQLVYFTLGVGRVQQTALITGGTGRYEGATGVILSNWQGPDLVFGEVTGEICWPED